MGLFDRFSKNKKNQKVQVEKRGNNTLQDAAAAIAFAEAGEHETARTMVSQTADSKKILAIGRADSFSGELTEYALGMATRLGFEIMALNVTDAPLSLPADKRVEACELFRQDSIKNVTAMKELAEKAGVPFNHVVEIGNQDDVLNILQAKYPGMRYVLTEPDSEVAKKSNGKVAIPVFDLGSYQGAVA